MTYDWDFQLNSTLWGDCVWARSCARMPTLGWFSGTLSDFQTTTGRFLIILDGRHGSTRLNNLITIIVFGTADSWTLLSVIATTTTAATVAAAATATTTTTTTNVHL